MTSPIAIDLFCGCGGTTQGLKDAQFTVIGAVDINPLSIETYKLNHPQVQVWESDIRQLEVGEVKKQLVLEAGQLDLLAGCPPCQGFSAMRTLNGARQIQDSRNDLVFDFIRFVRELQPKAILMENVPGLAKDKRLKVVCEALEALGYYIKFELLDAANYGVPQRRRRVIIFGCKFGQIEFPPQINQRLTVREAIAHLPEPGQTGDSLHDLLAKHCDRIMNLIRQIPKNGGGRVSLPPEMELKCHRNFGGFRDVYGRMTWDQVAPTITCGCINPSKGRFLHPQQDRAITLREAALLQTFPKSYQFSLRRGRYPVGELIGNALPPEFVKQLAKQIHKSLQVLEKQPNCSEFEQLPLFDLQPYSLHTEAENGRIGKRSRSRGVASSRSPSRAANAVPTHQKFKQLDLFE